MAYEIPESLLNLVEQGREKVRKQREQQEKEWNELRDIQKERWHGIENSVKDLLPIEVREFFSVSIENQIPTIKEFEHGFMVWIKSEDIERMRSYLPSDSIIGKKGTINIPGFATIDVSIGYIKGLPPFFFYAGGGVEPDGSLEVALYYAKAQYDSDTRARITA